MSVDDNEETRRLMLYGFCQRGHIRDIRIADDPRGGQLYELCCPGCEAEAELGIPLTDIRIWPGDADE